jgi:hypothetical protein
MTSRKRTADGALAEQRAEAEAQVANAVRAVTRQRKIAATMRRRNLNASDADARLVQLERRVLKFEEQLAAIIAGQAKRD